MLDAGGLKLNDEYRIVLRVKIQHAPHRQIAAIRRIVVSDAG